MDIKIDGHKLEHQLGDSMWYITNDKQNNFKLIVAEHKNFIDTICITAENEITFLGNSYPIDPTLGEFWTKEEAQEWLIENMPENLAVTKETDVFFCDKTGQIQIARVIGLIVKRGRIGYKTACRFSNWDFFTNDDIDKNIFLTYENLVKKKRG